jgi:hypothetical protein
MARLQTFLPELESANRQLDQQISVDPREVDIENVDEDEQYIEMVSFVGIVTLYSIRHSSLILLEFGIGCI